ncbi:MAG: UbiA family prenyltransferase [Thermoplasmata archaeon]
MKYIVKLLRPLNCFLASVSVPIILITLYGMERGGWPSWTVTAIGMIVVFTFTAGGNVLNDYIDRKVDRINHPDRPISSGKISPKSALALSGIMFVLSFSSSLLLPDILPKLIVVMAIAMIISYELMLKKLGLSGNMIISALTGLLFVFAGAVYGNILLPSIIGLLAGLSTLGREVTKDIQDMRGDFDRKTLPMRIGKTRSRHLVAGFVISAVMLSPLPYLFSMLPLSYLLIVIGADIIFIYSIFHLKEPRRAQRLIKVAMSAALVAFFIGGIV